MKPIKQVVTRDFYTHTQGREVPASIWMPQQTSQSLPLILVGHGGSGHKRSQLVQDVANALLDDFEVAVVAIDGPVHGSRREVFNDGPAVRQEFRDLWSSGMSVDPMVDDWMSCIDYLCQMPEIDSTKIGWYGISMGTAYGIPLVARDQRIKAAALGMWGTCREPSQRLKEDAEKIEIPVLFQVKEQDEIFTPKGQQELYELITSQDKTWKSYPGGHTDPKDQQLSDIVQFLMRNLKDH
jgi:cephalosporin-C deacetylase-like acetyl esterase